MRMWPAPDHTRLVFDLSASVEHRLFMLSDPDRIVIDLENAELDGELPGFSLESRFLGGVRAGQPEPNVLRIVLDLRRKAQPRTLVLTPNEVYGHRLVIDLYDRDDQRTPRNVLTAPPESKKNQVVIAIDAGHGGEDPGAIGRRGTREKQITLSVSRALKQMIDRDPQMQAVMIRDGDYYVSLRGRTAIARRHQADLFVSIHADALPNNRSVRGSSVYALSERGASSEAARWLADKENAADLIGGVSLRDKDDLLARVLWDLSMTKAVNDSLELGRYVLKELGNVGAVRHKRVEQAGFAVLKSPDIPSVLVETAFISNTHEERLLRSPRHRRKIATAIYRGIRDYVQREPRFRSVVATSGVYVVQKGDSLSAIAQRYRVSVVELKRLNNLSDDVIQVGQKLRIPGAAAEG